ncbi:hypothetical protein C4D60_Mb08t24800 [Musa balbisiana]|uniref:Uncharacterized protein n=1 Tax=Musa balbisiana TaxID=52838 RepID=A0A4S8K683_MUSBA|nr:hypothetical protein C4D60_Mb08t24800 [Musa balbisiana]
MGRKEERSVRFIGMEGENVRIWGGGRGPSSAAEPATRPRMRAAPRVKRSAGLGPHRFCTNGDAGRERKRNR